jgi:hypothetical protein
MRRVTLCLGGRRRGKKGRKHYTVFLCDVTAAARAAWVPELDLKEHTEWRWFDLMEAAAMKEKQLHPVVAILFDKTNLATIKSTLGMGP